ncbi:hypothetical protein CANINC_002911 [Pichia inconspicua]|uniref:Uncharacterized protein n=1 Tax=Pichia inconspicua TaxID=52247 RepID=A0A4T0WZY9_9ASCO|nr:hypothetical protein CANINC_002911 [[Candida] inconspicua]
MNTLTHIRPTTVKNLASIAKRNATTISSPNDTKLTNLLARLDKFDNDTKIFDKLDALYLLSQRKGFFNLNSNNLEFLSNSNKINNNMNNLYNFNNLNKLVSNQYAGSLMLPNATSPSSINGVKSANIIPLPRTAFNSNSTTNFFKPSMSSIANSIPGLNAFSVPATISSGSNAPVDKYLNLLQGLAKNDVELKNNIEQVLEAFNKEDDFFFNYVLEFWISGKSFNKIKAKKLQDKLGQGQLPSNLTM